MEQQKDNVEVEMQVQNDGHHEFEDIEMDTRNSYGGQLPPFVDAVENDALKRMEKLYFQMHQMNTHNMEEQDVGYQFNQVEMQIKKNDNPGFEEFINQYSQLPTFVDAVDNELDDGLDDNHASEVESDQLEDDDDEIVLQSEEQSEEMVNEMFKLMKETFGMDMTKSIIIRACKKNGIELFKTSNRESTSSIRNITVDGLKIRIARFASATLDTTLVLNPMNTKKNIIDNCMMVNSKIISVEAGKEVLYFLILRYTP
ncbi:uncharacterized protein ATC70_004001 [Mucor velutinosus]|uniref:Uncharacterized protein n=1 Tax=Mucor velutinosus TaxID=708070 RepID=A0AAN7HYE8_9FUNG|nr:hypothetical protein ATC70_004001 [Mucor velutinosus]